MKADDLRIPNMWYFSRFGGFKPELSAVKVESNFNIFLDRDVVLKTSQEMRMLSNVTLNCQVAKIVMNLGSQLSEL